MLIRLSTLASETGRAGAWAGGAGAGGSGFGFGSARTGLGSAGREGPAGRVPGGAGALRSATSGRVI
jgi:hypothetical protein